MTATLNINLGQCDTPHLCAANGGEHVSVCAARPAPIPCPIPRSVTFDVRIGECDSPLSCISDRDSAHVSGCPARPVRVSCSITSPDGSWERSVVVDCEVNGYAANEPEWHAAADRWALVKALVTGKGPRDWAWTGVVTDGTAAVLVADLFAQRDAVFAALAKAHRAEGALIEALGDYEEAMRGEVVGIYGLKRESHGALGRYVTRLIEQAGAMP